ncbi:glycosyl transferase family 11 [Jezberella montanilacus]|uniref:Glycosyl transferase family 11 n=1 Tax=Jezberella montanilacus TaxID=323426 RepID=A0A2T0XI68_9BURK|nr:alpha-1,2-fucosyltransferase [Jezberella montanilacus]PRY98648.1 glycosyl transferase family 11 [Jezberella montanilacus]
MKVILRIRGGLGNQLFAYAAAKRVALKNDGKLHIDSISGFQFDTTYQQKYQLEHFNINCSLASSSDRLEPFARIRRYVKRWINNRVPFEKRNYIQQVGNAFDPRLLKIKPRNYLYIEGYWQSEQYFKDIEEVIREDLQIKPPADLLNVKVSQFIQSCTAVAVHVRFFDKPDAVGDNNATADYYANALAAMQQYAPDAHYFLFSDDVIAARSLIQVPDINVTLVSHNQGTENAYADLWLMTQCKHFIIANSTFSWWGAWLSQHKNKIVIAPGFTRQSSQTAWGFDGLLPDSWIKI